MIYVTGSELMCTTFAEPYERLKTFHNSTTFGVFFCAIKPQMRTAYLSNKTGWKAGGNGVKKCELQGEYMPLTLFELLLICFLQDEVA